MVQSSVQDTEAQTAPGRDKPSISASSILSHAHIIIMQIIYILLLLYIYIICICIYIYTVQIVFSVYICLSISLCIGYRCVGENLHLAQALIFSSHQPQRLAV